MSTIKTNKKGENNPAWIGGRRLFNGYILVYQPEHPHPNGGGRNNCVFEHRLVMEKHLGRFLTKKEIVHHVNGIKTDNRIENLELTTPSKHIKEHHSDMWIGSREAWMKKRKNKLCLVCKESFLQNSPHGKFCRECKEKHGRNLYFNLNKILCLA